MKRIVPVLLMTCLTLVSAGQSPDKSDGKITIKITKEINGEKKTFEGEYENEAQMRADPNYQEFAGEDDNISLWFGEDAKDNLMLHLDHLKSNGNFNFNFGHADSASSIFFKHFDGDSNTSFNFNSWDSEEYKEKLKQLGIEMETFFEHLDGDGESRVFVFSKRIHVSDVDGEFGEKGEVRKNNVLDLADLSFSPNPSSNGRFNVRFKVPEENELSIKVFNLEGKEIYNRYFERFGGMYSETIDLSGQDEGIYLLEISQSNKRLTKKIVIN